MAGSATLKRGGGGALTCALCPKLCRFACPTAQAAADEARHPTGILSFAVMADHGTFDLTGDGGEVLYHCTSCYACSVPCELGQVPVEILHGLRVRHRPPRVEAALRALRTPGGAGDAEPGRGEAGRGGAGPAVPPGATGVAAGRDGAGPAVLRGATRVAAGGDGAGPAVPRGATVVWAGRHDGGSDPALPSDLAALLGRLGAGEVVVLDAGHPACCGWEAWALGDEALASARFVDTALRVAGAAEVVFLDPECLHAFRRLVPRGGQAVGARLHHATEALAARLDVLGPLLDGARDRDGGGPAVAWHDPCLLARSSGVHDAPRALIERATGRPPREFVRSRDRTECCGAGGGHARVFPEAAREVAAWALRDPVASEVGVLLTGSPACAAHLAPSAGPLPVRDVVRFLLGRVEVG